jgi:hypothetical protein
VLENELAPDEVVDLVSVRDADERRILSTDEYAGVSHHGDEEGCLTIREPERRKRSITASGKTIRICPMWFRLRCCDHLKACSYKRSEIADS